MISINAPERKRSTMWRRYATFIRTPPELTVEWHDAATGARAWLVVNSLRGGAAGGGTRMRIGLDPREVIYLSKAMELKFSLSGPPIGGAKNGIAFDPQDPRKHDVLERWYRWIEPYLRDRYGTGGDLNVDEVLDVIPAFERIGLTHPQQGVIKGYLNQDDAAFRETLQRMGAGVEAPLCDSAIGIDAMALTAADMITGYGVAVSVRRLYERQGRPLDGVRVSLEGFGNVGAAAGLYLARFGARLVAIRDAERLLVEPRGLDATDVESLVRHRQKKLLPSTESRATRDVDAMWDVEADVFVAAALSESLTSDRLVRLEHAGVQVIAAGANQPFRELKIGSTQVARRADHRFTILADILANCGMARTFSYLMEPAASPDAHTIFSAVKRTIEDTLDEVVDRNTGRNTGLLAATLGLALDRIGA
ncbi:MAG: Glu/Leu/Phe/Val dehydrogenase dimerization domain-containing protein [Longimicrobiales bacterium]